MELDETGDVQYSQEQADEKRFTPRKSPHAGEFGGFGDGGQGVSQVGSVAVERVREAIAVAQLR